MPRTGRRHRRLVKPLISIMALLLNLFEFILVSRIFRNCGEMTTVASTENAGPVCKSGAQILYAWAMDAPALELPEGSTSSNIYEAVHSYIFSFMFYLKMFCTCAQMLHSKLDRVPTSKLWYCRFTTRMSPRFSEQVGSSEISFLENEAKTF